jgi:starch synthase
MHVLLATSELHPFSKTGGLADMVAALGRALAATGVRVSVVTPLYRGIQARHPGLRPAGWKFGIPVGPDLVDGEFHRLDPAPGLTLWFVRQDAFFDRPGLYNEGGKDYADNSVRFLFLTRAALLLARHLPDPPRIVHGHDWQTGLLPLYLQHERASGAWPTAPRSVFTIHNLAYQGWFPEKDWSLTGLAPEWFHVESARHHGHLNFLKAALTQSNAITTVSPTYAREILTPEYGCGLEGLLKKRYNDLTGILNGVDYAEWNTTANPALPAAFTADDLSGKARCKAALQQELGLPVRDDLPLFTNITRLTEQKGSELILAVLERLLREGASLQFALLGSGDKALEQGYRTLETRFPRQVAARIGFDAVLAHRLEAGADFYLMPSRFEPCGLNQLYSLRYGAIPVVRATGGLQDSVTDTREDADHATGIKFHAYDPRALEQAVRKALAVWAEPPWLAHLRRNGMTADFSWERQTAEYLALYQDVAHG